MSSIPSSQLSSRSSEQPIETLPLSLFRALGLPFIQMDAPMEITVFEIPIAMENLQFVSDDKKPSTLTIEEINE